MIKGALRAALTMREIEVAKRRDEVPLTFDDSAESVWKFSILIYDDKWAVDSHFKRYGWRTNA